MIAIQQQLAVRLIRLTNIGGIRGTLEIPLGQITYLEGDNGIGKSSAMDGVAALFGGPILDLLNKDEDEGEIYLELTDGTWFRRRITRDGKNELTAGDGEKGKISRAAAWLRATLSSATVSVADFIEADDVKAAEYILRAVPMKVSREEVSAALGAGIDLPDVDLDGHALTVLDKMIRAFYDERTGENRTAKDARAELDNLSKSIPEEVPDPQAIEERVGMLESALEEIKGLQKSAEDEAKAQAREELDRELEAANASITSLTATGGAVPAGTQADLEF